MVQKGIEEGSLTVSFLFYAETSKRKYRDFNDFLLLKVLIKLKNKYQNILDFFHIALIAYTRVLVRLITRIHFNLLV